MEVPSQDPRAVKTIARFSNKKPKDFLDYEKDIVTAARQMLLKFYPQIFTASLRNAAGVPPDMATIDTIRRHILAHEAATRDLRRT